MMKPSYNLLGILFKATLLISLCFLGSACKHEKSCVQLGCEAPDFQLKTPSGDTIQLSDYRGKPVILDFWAINCPYCVAEMADFQHLYDEYQDQGLMILAINENETGSEVGYYVAKNELTYTFLLDSQEAVGSLYQVVGIPTSFFLDPSGVIQKIGIGQITRDVMYSNLTAVLPEK